MPAEIFPFFSPYQKRKFVPYNADLTDKEHMEAIFRTLEKRIINSVNDFEEWIYDRSEMDAAMDQTEALLYIQMTAQTDDKEKADSYNKYTQDIQPLIKEWDDILNKKLMETDKKFHLDRDSYSVHLRNIETDMRLFRNENVNLEKDEDDLKQKYQTMCGAMTIILDSKEVTLQEAAKVLYDPDRSKRELIWKAIVERRLRDKNKIEEIMDGLIVLRHKIASNAGFKGYADYQFIDQHKFDYTPEDCKKFHTEVEEIVLPLWKKIIDYRKKLMSLDKIKPWDLSVDPLFRPPLKPFSTVKELTEKCQSVFSKVDNMWGSQFARMIEWNVLDLESRKGKAPGGYQSTLQEARKPFIFMNAVGLDSDLRTLLHEGGHAFHALACTDQQLVYYRHAPLEFCEVASMGMELLGGEYLDVFYNLDEKNRSQIDHLEDVVWTMLWVAVIDKFQHWLYENPNHSTENRADAWNHIYGKLGGDLIDWSGLEEARLYLWHRQLHVFETPFYYIEYAIAQIGALQLWDLYKHDQQQTIMNFKKALSLGGSKPLPVLFETAGIKFDFSKQTIAEVMSTVESEWEKSIKN